ncbi:MAG: aldehyde:ferredoxin oxidoreductase [Firmicutes bacterium]|nr:aldehyde:ferredoxin oxidoreductase [Bacillota bacterium]
MLNQKYIRVLTIDLTSQTFDIEERADLYEYLGGSGVAVQLFSETVNPNLDAYAPAQPIVFAIGPLSTIYPAVTKTVAMFRSPLTGELGESHAGLRSALAMRFAGYDAIVIRGRAARATYLSIGSRSVDFKNAEPLWGLSTEEAGRLLRELEPGMGQRSCLRIGPAGEKLVAFAGVNVDTFRHFGRLGLGAVFGSKNLKAIVIYGKNSYPISKFKEYAQVYQEIYTQMIDTELMEKYHDLGTSVNVAPLSAMHALPTRNLQQSSFEQAEQISGESFAAEALIRKMACPGCPVGCIHIGICRRQFAGDGFEWESATVSYDHELIYALGSMLGVGDKNDLLALIEKVELHGLDAISTGVLLAWVTEAYTRGLITEQEVGGPVAFGETAHYLEVIDRLVTQPNEFYQVLARGTAAAAERYGGQEFALTLGKNEVAGYHTGYANILGQLVGARHSHLDNAGYSLDQTLTEYNPEKIVSALIEEEQIRCALTSLCICLFARKVYDPPTVIKALGAIGIDLTEEQFIKLGKKIWRLKLAVKRRLGYDETQLNIPKRFFETPGLKGQLNEQTMEELRRLYREKIRMVL